MKLKEILGVVALVIAILASAVIVGSYVKSGIADLSTARVGGSSDSGYNATGNGVYAVDGTTVIDGSGQLTLGTNGTQLAAIKTGSCTIWASGTTITATSSQQVECQSATDGSLASGLTGITTDSICSLTMASSTNTTLGTLVVGGSSASSTAGSIVARIINLTGTTFTWDATASSSPKWNYTCLDPA